MLLADEDTPEGFEEAYWARHSNPKSGWSRVLVIPTILYAVYHRNWRLVAGALLFTIINPFLFSPPKNDAAWMTRVVRAEQWWKTEKNQKFIDASYPNLLNLLNIPATGYAFLTAYRRQPLQAALAGLTSMALKFWYVGALVRRYDAEKSESS